MRTELPKVIIGSLLLAQVFAPLSGFSASTEPTFRDVRDSATAKAVEALNFNGAIQTSSNFYPGRLVNRAEFLKMAEIIGNPGFSPAKPDEPCFADVDPDSWYARWVCLSKEQGLVGYANPAGGPNLFKPSQNVTYAEGVKILLSVFDMGTCPQPGDNPWYESCIAMAKANGLDIGIAPGAQMSRAQAARLIAAFGWDSGHIVSSSSVSSSRSSSRSSSSSSSSRPSSSSSSTSSSASSVSGTFDPNTDLSVHSQFLLLGETGPVMGAFKVFLYEEPLNITAIQVNASITGPAVDAFLIYDENRRYLGRATSTASSPTIRTYRLELQNGTLTVPQKEEMSFYARPVLMSKDGGGQSGLVTKIHNVTFEGNGFWSNRSYVKASTETFVDFQTARGIITSVKNAGQTQEFLLSGTDRKVGSFTFTARKNDGSARVQVTNLEFTIEQAGGVTVSNMRIGMANDSTRYACSVAGSTATCTLPSDIGVIDEAKTFNVYADVTVPSTNSASLRLSLNEGGSVSSAGSVTWTDGTTSFTWLPTGGGAVASGTLYKY